MISLLRLSGLLLALSLLVTTVPATAGPGTTPRAGASADGRVKVCEREPRELSAKGISCQEAKRITDTAFRRYRGGRPVNVGSYRCTFPNYTGSAVCDHRRVPNRKWAHAWGE